MKRLKGAIQKATGHKVKYIFSYNLSAGGFIDYGTGDKTYSIKLEDLFLRGSQDFAYTTGGNI